jgi:hypothetical protein
MGMGMGNGYGYGCKTQILMGIGFGSPTQTQTHKPSFFVWVFLWSTFSNRLDKSKIVSLNDLFFPCLSEDYIQVRKT